jgi:hypothetical protein
MCDWSSLPAGELGPVPFFGLKKDGLSCAVQPTGLLLCGDASTPSTVFAEVGQQLNEVRFGRRGETTQVERLQPCYWYEDHGQTLCRQPMTDQTTTPVMLDALRTDGICTFAGGSYTSAPTPSVPDNVEDAVDLRLILYTLLTDENNIQQHQTILAKVPVDEDLVLETYLSDSAHNGVLDWQTTDKLVEPSHFQEQLTLVRDEDFNGLAVLTMAVMPGSGDTRSFEVKGLFPDDGIARLVRRHVVRRMDVTPDAPPDFNITKLITVAQEYVDLQKAVDEANKTLRDTWIEGLRHIGYDDIENDSQRQYIVQTLHANMSVLYQKNEDSVRHGLRVASTTGHECSHEVHRLHMSPILYGACRDYTAPVVDSDGPVRTPRSVRGEDFVIPIPPSAMQSDAFAQGTMPDVYTPPRRSQAVGSDFEVQQDHDVAFVVDNVPNFELLETLCVVRQGFPCNRTNMEEMLKRAWGGLSTDHLGFTSKMSSVGRWITQRLFYGEPARSDSDSPSFDLSMVDAFVRDWEINTYGYNKTPSGNEVITAQEIQILMQDFFPNETWSWPDPVTFTRPIMNDGRIESWLEVTDLPEDQRPDRIKTGLMFNTLRYNVLDSPVTVTQDEAPFETFLVWVGTARHISSDPNRYKTTRRQALGRLLAFVSKAMFPEGPECFLTSFNEPCLCLRENSIDVDIGCNVGVESTFLLENQGEWNMLIPNPTFAMCDATAHQELLMSNRNGKRGGPMNVMMLVLQRLYPNLYAQFLTFLSCRSVVDETPEDPLVFTTEPSKGLRRPVVVHTARDDVCAELSEWNLGQNWEVSAKENSVYVTSCQLVEAVASHDVLQLVHLGLASETLQQDVCQRWGAFKSPSNALYFDPYATALKYQLAQGLRLASGDEAGVDSTISVLPVKVHVHTDTVDLTHPENTASVHKNQTLYEWFAMFDHTKDAHTFRINPVAQNHVYQYTGFGQPLLTPARDVVSTPSTLYDVIKPNNVPSDHKFLDKWKQPFQRWIQSSEEPIRVEAQWLTPRRNHLPPSQRQAAISESRFDISPDFLAWRWNARAMASDTDSAEDIGRRIETAEWGVAHLTRVATGQCGLMMDREDAHVTSSPTLQWTRDEDGRTYQIDKNFSDPDHVLYVFRD